MDQRFGRGQELKLEPGYRNLEIGVTAKLGGDAVELRLGPAIAFMDHVGIGEDQILGDLAELGVVAEHRHLPFLVAGRQRQV